jgi:acyl-CoA synthetase (NDP forming)/RimJ/RimL family protein N-acetyltransferase
VRPTGVSPRGSSRALVRDVLLRDGSTLRLQTPSPADFDEIKSFYDGLSWESQFLRFRGYPRTDLVARVEANASGVERFTLIGRQSGRVVAAAAYVELREKGVAEVSFAVADEFQRRGIATRMLEQLASAGAEHGIRRFDAEVMAENRAMVRLFEHAGFGVRRVGSGGDVTVSLDITPDRGVQERIGERDHVGAVAALRSVLAPASIAVVGTAGASGDLLRQVMTNIGAGGFRGQVLPVDPNGGVLGGRPAVRSLGELEVAPELVIVASAGEELLGHAAAAAAARARALLVLSSDGDESQPMSSAQEQQLIDVLRDAGMRMVGAGSLGVVNTAGDVCLNATFSSARLRPGGLAMGSHTVASGLGLLGYAAAHGLGVSAFVSLGNRGDVSTSDLVEWFAEDERTRALMLHVEDFGDPRRFMRVAQRVSREKPILVLKGQRRTERAGDEPASQTAAALGGDEIFDTVLRHAGVLRFRGGEELCQAAELLESQPLPHGSHVGIVSNSRSLADLAAESCTTRGLDVGRTAGGVNPLIVSFDAGAREYEEAVRGLLTDRAIDAVMPCYVDPHDGDPASILESVSDACASGSKPAVACVVGSDGLLPAPGRPSVPNFLFPEACAAALARAVERRAWLSRPMGEPPSFSDIDAEAARTLLDSVIADRGGGGWLDPEQLEELLATHGVPLATALRARDLGQALEMAAAIAGPVALKAHLPAPARASEIHAVLLGLRGDDAIAAGWEELQRCVRAAGQRWHGAIVQPLAPPGADVLVGAVRDPDLGTVVGVGLGGRQAGYGKATAFRLPPVTDVEADELIDACEPVAAELASFPGGRPLDRVALRELILRFALLIETVPELVEADLNTIRCTTHGCSVLDARMRLEPLHPPEKIKTW